MGMGRKEQQRRQEELWIAHTELPRTVGHPFYEQLNRLLEESGFDEYVEQQCARFCAEKMGRPSLAPGRYFRLLLIGYFEGIDSERGIAWRAADSLGLRNFLGVGLNEMPPDHSTISRTRRLIDVETHQAVFRWVLQLLAEKGLLRGKTVGIDATTLEANAALRSIVRRETGEDYQEFLRRLAQESGIATPTREELAKLDRKRAHKGSDEDWVNAHDPEALGVAVVRTYISEPDRGQRHWQNKPEARQAVYDNRRRIRGEHGKQLLRRRGELVERSFAHAYETGGMRRVHLRGRDNVLKRMLIHVGGFNLSLVMRKLLGKGTPRGLQGLSAENLLLLLRFWVAVLDGAAEESASTPMFMSSHALPSRFLLCSRQNERISSATGC